MTIDRIVEEVRRDGFSVARGFLAPREVARLRAVCRGAMSRATKVGGGRVLWDLQHELPEVHRLLIDERTVSLARAVVGGRVLELHQDAVHQGPVNRGWHKDAADYMQGRRDGPDWADDYRIVHFAWYLQDHVQHAGGISFRRGSHRIRDDRGGTVVTPPIAAGDLALFDLRTTHFGNTIQLRDGRPLFLDRVWRKGTLPFTVAARVVRALPALFRPEHGDERFVVFAMYGGDDAHTRRFFSWLRTQPDLLHVRRYTAPTPLDEDRVLVS